MEKLSFLIAFGLLAIFFIFLSIYLLTTGYQPNILLLTLIFSGFAFTIITVGIFFLLLFSMLKPLFLDKEERFTFLIALGVIALILLGVSIYLLTAGYPPDIILLCLVLGGIVFSIMTIVALFLYLTAAQALGLTIENKELLVFGVAIAALVITGILRLMDRISQDVWLNVTLLIVTNLITGKVVYEYTRRLVR